jgi:ankyrin repeat protein
MYAARDGHVDVVEILLKANASYEAKDLNGWTAAQFGQKFPDIVSLLEKSVVDHKGVWVCCPF